jgi:AraC-like DNA-binding protein
MHYQEIQPDKFLENYISCYWKFSTSILPGNKDSMQHYVLPDGCVSVCFLFQETTGVFGPLLMGPRTEIFQTQIFPNSAVIGIRFMPGAFRVLFDLNLTPLRNQVLFDQKLIPEFADKALLQSINLHFQNFTIFDDFLKNLIQKSGKEAPIQIQKAVQLILKEKGNIKIEELAKKVHWSIRHFQRQFKFFTGLTPKEFVKNIRLRNSMIQVLLEEEGLQDVLFDAGYYDQSHFNRDFSMVAGLNPTNFLKYIQQIDHKGINN